jgi:hypothetical protein
MKQKIMSMKKALTKVKDSPEDKKADKVMAKKIIKSSKYAKGGTVGDEKKQAAKYGTNQEDANDESNQDYGNTNNVDTSSKTSSSDMSKETPSKKTMLQRYQENKGGYKRALAAGTDKDGNATDPTTGLKYKVDNNKNSTKKLQSLTDKDKATVNTKQANKNMVIKNDQRLDAVKDNYLPPSAKTSTNESRQYKSFMEKENAIQKQKAQNLKDAQNIEYWKYAKRGYDSGGLLSGAIGGIMDVFNTHKTIKAQNKELNKKQK